MDYKEKLQLKEDLTEKVHELLREDGIVAHRIKGAIALEAQDEVVVISAVVKKNFDLAEAVEEYEQKLAEQKAKEDKEKSE